MPRIVPSTDAAIAEAADRLRAGGLVVFPTETVYGLGADAFDPDALRQVFELKGRPSDNPLIAHVLDHKQGRTLVSAWNGRCDELTARFWPGPLTLVLPKSASVPDLATAALPTVAVRAPAHPVARQLLSAFGSPICAPSANRSGHISPTRAEHVASDFADVDDLMILDGGPCEVGIESTVLDLTGSSPRILRPGGITVEQLRAVLGDVESPVIEQQAPAPGTTLSHYAPRTPAELVNAHQMRERLSQLPDAVVVLCFNPADVPAPHRAIVMPATAEAYANRLYEALRQADALDYPRILIERPPLTEGVWRAIHDRLARATASAQSGRI